MEKSKNLRKAVYQIDESMKEKFPPKTTSNEVNEELDYCRQVITVKEKGHFPPKKQTENGLFVFI